MEIVETFAREMGAISSSFEQLHAIMARTGQEKAANRAYEFYESLMKELGVGYGVAVVRYSK